MICMLRAVIFRECDDLTLLRPSKGIVLETTVTTMTIPMNMLRRNTLRGLMVLALTVCLFAAPLFAAPMTNADREHLLVHFEMTTQMVAELVRGLSPAQL